MFDHAVFMAKLAMRASKLGGILWHQGENDCVNEDLYNSYPQRFEKFISTLKKEIGIEDIPFIAGELSPYLAERLNMQGRNIEFNKKEPTRNKLRVGFLTVL